MNQRQKEASWTSYLTYLAWCVINEAILSMNTVEYFGLNEQPFRIGPDPRYLFYSGQVKEAIAKCEYMARDRVGPIYMYGPHRVGQDLHPAPAE